MYTKQWYAEGLFLSFTKTFILRNQLTQEQEIINFSEVTGTTVYFRLRFGLVKSINTYTREKICVMSGVILNLKCVLIEFANYV